MKPWSVEATYGTLDGSGDARVNCRNGKASACGGDEGGYDVGVDDLVVAVYVDGDSYVTNINFARVSLGLSKLGLTLLGFFFFLFLVFLF